MYLLLEQSVFSRSPASIGRLFFIPRPHLGNGAERGAKSGRRCPPGKQRKGVGSNSEVSPLLTKNKAATG